MVLSRIEKPLFEKLNQNDLARLEPEISERAGSALEMLLIIIREGVTDFSTV